MTFIILGDDLHSIASHYTAREKLFEKYSPLMEVGGLYSAAFVTAVLLELRRLMPFGIKWFSEDVVNNTTTVIGGMLYAESEMYYQAALSLYTIESQRSPLTAKFDKAKDWFNLITGGNTSMSEVLSKRLLQLYFSYDSADLNIYRQLLDDFFGIESTLTFKSVPDFLVYDMSSAKLNYIPVTPGRGAQLTGSVDSGLTKEEYYSIVYKFVGNDWVKRRVPGFPMEVNNVNVFQVVTEVEYLANPKPEYAIEEGTDGVAILPLANYVMQAEIDLDGASPHLLEWLNDTLLPAGLLVKYTSTMGIVGDG